MTVGTGGASATASPAHVPDGKEIVLIYGTRLMASFVGCGTAILFKDASPSSPEVGDLVPDRQAPWRWYVEQHPKLAEAKPNPSYFNTADHEYMNAALTTPSKEGSLRETQRQALRRIGGPP